MSLDPLIQHHRSNTPAFIFHVPLAPLNKHKNSKIYKSALQEAARAKMQTPILSNDIEIEVIYSTAKNQFNRSDLDNILKPTLDALKQIAYDDDRRIRSVRLTLFNKNSDLTFSGRVEILGPLMTNEDVILIAIYSDSKLKELGGESKVSAERQTGYFHRLSNEAGLKLD